MEPLEEVTNDQLEIQTVEYNTVAIELYGCKTCGKYFDKESKLYSHSKTHSSKNYTCYICLKSFSVKAYLDAHLAIHVSEKLFKCNMCSKAFATAKYLYQHKKLHSKEKPFTCSVCSKAFSCKKYLSTHEKIHSDNKMRHNSVTNIKMEVTEAIQNIINPGLSVLNKERMSCSTCSKTFSTKRSLEKHMRNVHYLSKTSTECNEDNEMQQQNSDPKVVGSTSLRTCPVCFDEFSKGYLRKHMKRFHPDYLNNNPQTKNHNISTLEEKIMVQPRLTLQSVCQLCSKAFTNDSTLAKHIKHMHLNNEEEISRLKPEIKEALQILMDSKPKQSAISCNKCLNTFSTTSKLNEHIKYERCTRGYKCPFCEKYFKKNSSFQFHLKEHNGKPPIEDSQNLQFILPSDSYSNEQEALSSNDHIYKCQICNKKFLRKFIWSRHMRLHTSNKKFKCDVCSKTFSFKQALGNHKRYYHSNIYECHICYQSFSRKKSLENHMKVHIHEETYSCEVCGWVFCSQAVLEKHQLSHAQDEDESKLFICDVCEAIFEDSAMYLKHMKQHTGIPCKVCNLYLCNERSLKRHMKQHEGEKIYECDLCPKRFAQICDLTNHKVSHFEEQPEEQTQCETCGMKFETAVNLQRHMARTHPNHHCKMCRKTFITAYRLRRHMRMHSGEKPFTCDICGKSFSQSGNLSNHKNIHFEEKQFECNICSMSFKQKTSWYRHVKTHSQATFFKCDICCKAFITSTSLLDHKKKTSCGK